MAPTAASSNRIEKTTSTRHLPDEIPAAGPPYTFDERGRRESRTAARRNRYRYKRRLPARMDEKSYEEGDMGDSAVREASQDIPGQR
ncbi:MAG: hypothetical protein ACLS37_11285 [Alistipes sp.]